MDMKKTIAMLSIAGMISAMNLAGCSQSTHPYDYSNAHSDIQSSVGTSIAIDELTIAHLAGVPVDSSDGVFSIGWNPFVGPADQDSERLGDASVIVFDTLALNAGPRSSHPAEDIGSVYLNYSGNHQEFRKIHHFFGGTFYSFFPRWFGNTDPGVSFEANTSYQFEVTGSSSFSAASVSISSPPALISITSQSNGQQVNADSDLALSWSGGNPVAGVLIRVIPMIDFGPDGFAAYGTGMRMRSDGVPPGIHDGGPDRPVRIDTGYTLRLANNAGKAVIPAAVIQELIYATSALSVTVSEFSTVEFNQDSRKYLIIMRDGDRRMVVVK